MQRIITAVLLILTLTSCGQVRTTQNSDIIDGFVGEKEPVTRAEVAKMLALSKYSSDQLDNLERTIVFEDSSIDNWYDKYINGAYTAGLIAGTDEKHFSPDDTLSLSQAQILIKKINQSGNFELKFSESDKDRPISYKIWLEAFSKAAGNSVSQYDIFVYATGSQCSELGEKYILCNGGLRSADGIDFSPYVDKIVRVVMKDNEILGISKVVNSAPVLKNVEIASVDGDDITVKIKGAQRIFSIKDSEHTYKEGDRLDITFSENGEYRISPSAT